MTKSTTKPIMHSIMAETHPPYYLVHKYWARKPSNVVRAYIEHFTKPSEIVLDPFVGSGVTVIEGIRTGRKAIGIDINPIATMLSYSTAVGVSASKLYNYAGKLEEKIKPVAEDLFRAKCTSCGELSGLVTHVVWSTRYRCPNVECSAIVSSREARKRGAQYLCPKCSGIIPVSRAGFDEIPIELWHVCSNCNYKEKREPNDDDMQLLERINSIPVESLASSYRMVRNPRLLIFGDTRVRDFFTHRNLIILSTILNEIESIKEEDIREVFRTVFTASVAQASKLVAYRNGLSSGGPAWTVSGFWIPSLHFEINAWTCFKTRLEKMVRGKMSLSELHDDTLGLKEFRRGNRFGDILSDKNVLLINKSITEINEEDVPDESVDYIFADPPYGDSVPYLEYCQVWYSWFGYKPDFDHEIIISNSTERTKDINDYRHLLELAFAQCHRVLKNEHWLTITFHNRDIDVWEALLASVIAAGFRYVNCTYQIPAVIPAKAQLVKNSSMKGDIIINFTKTKDRNKRRQLTQERVRSLVSDSAKKVVAFHAGKATDDQVWRAVLLSLLEHGDSRIMQTEIKNYVSSALIKRDNFWVLKEQDCDLLSKAESLEELVTRVTLAELRNGNGSEKLILARVYDSIGEFLTPDMEDVLPIIKRLKQSPLESGQTRLISNQGDTPRQRVAKS